MSVTRNKSPTAAPRAQDKMEMYVLSSRAPCTLPLLLSVYVPVSRGWNRGWPMRSPPPRGETGATPRYNTLFPVLCEQIAADRSIVGRSLLSCCFVVAKLATSFVRDRYRTFLAVREGDAKRATWHEWLNGDTVSWTSNCQRGAANCTGSG